MVGLLSGEKKRIECFEVGLKESREAFVGEEGELPLQIPPIVSRLQSAFCPTVLMARQFKNE